MPSALDHFLQDVRYALRNLFRTPAFSLTAILATALAIGACTAVFSAVDRVLFRSLPYTEESRLVSVGMMAPLDSNEFLFAAPYFELQRQPGPFAQITAFQAGAVATDLTEGQAVRLRAVRLEANFLDVFGIRPVLGRAFTREEDRPNAAAVTLISYGLWQTRFGGDPGIAGHTLQLDGAPVRIVGVLPKEFEMPTLTEADLALPLALDETRERSGRALRVFGRLKPGISVEAAREQMAPAFRRALETVPPQFRKEISLRVRPVRDRAMGEARTASLALFGCVLAVLLIACANIAGLLTARAVSRRQEMAIRTALGASRARLARQALTESLVLSAMGAIAGYGFAAWLLRIFVSLAPAALPHMGDAALDGRALLFTLGAAAGSGLLFGMAPAMWNSGSLWLSGARTAGSSGRRFRAALIALEIALSMAPLTCAAMLLRSLWNLEAAPLGMESDHVVTARFTLGRQRYATPEQQLAFFNQLEGRLANTPGIGTAAISDTLPPIGGTRSRPFAAIDIDGRPRMPEGTGGMVGWRYVTPGYFAALGIPMLRGRGFTEADRGPAEFTAVLSESLARRLFPNENPIGKRILKGPRGEWTTVIGVAHDVVNFGPTRASEPEYYLLRKHAADFNFANQEPPTGWRSAVVIARTTADVNLVAASLRGLFDSMEPALPVEIASLPQRLDELDAKPRFYALLLTVFAGAGVLIAAIGLYGVMSYLVSQRTREIGVRMALGATPGRILRDTLHTALSCTLAGIALGVIGSVAAGRVVRSLLFRVTPQDPLAIAAAAGALCAVALIAAALPARRAAALDPNGALRRE